MPKTRQGGAVMCSANDDPSQHDAPRCSGFQAAYLPAPWGWERMPCGARTGLSSWTDYHGETRYACRWHRAEVERRFGVMEPQPDWLVPA
jgi:hypothetical protein